MGNEYIQYQKMTNTVVSGMSRLRDVCSELGMPAQMQALEEQKKRMNDHVFSVGILGEFKRGKSTIINALMGENALPTNPLPTTATLNYVRWDSENRAEVVFKDGRVQRIPFEELNKYVTKLTAENAATAQTVDYAAVYCPCQFCQNGVQIIDTPGLNDDERMTAITEQVVPKTDAIIMVISAMSPFGESEASFVRDKIMASDLGRLLFVVNFINMIDEEDRPILVQSIHDKIQTAVLDKMKSVFGEDSEEYKNALQVVGDIKIIPVNAKQALRAKVSGDMAALEGSGFSVLENALSDLLTKQRGMLELIPPLKKVQSIAAESTQMIETRMNALHMDAEEFYKIQSESRESIALTREKKKTEIATIKAKGKTLYVDLVPQIDQEYAQIESELQECIAEIEITTENIKDNKAKKAFAEQSAQTINNLVREKFSIATERLYVKICEQLGRDIEQLEKVAKDIREMQEEIRVQISNSNSGSAKSLAMSALIDVGVTVGTGLSGSFIPGVGGIIAGFKNGGIKGALVGGGASVAIMTALSIALGPISIPTLIVASIASTVVGGGLAKLIFGKSSDKKADKVEKEIQALRTSMQSAITDTIKKSRKERLLEKWLQENCQTLYEKVADDIDREWDATLEGMETSLEKIAADLAENEATRRLQEENLNALYETIKDTMTEIQPIQAKVNEAVAAEIPTDE